MGKNINKLAAIGVVLSISSIIMPVHAAETLESSTESKCVEISADNSDSHINVYEILSENESEVKSKLGILPLQKVIDSAIEEDEQIKIYESQINYYEELDDYYDEEDDDFGEDKNDVNLSSVKQCKNFREDAVEYEVTKLYNNILLLEKQIEQQGLVIKNKTAETENFKSQYRIGIKTASQLETQEEDLQKEKDLLQDENNKLINLKRRLSLTSGIDISDFSLEDTLDFSPYKINGDLDEYIDSSIDTITRYSKKLIDLYKDELDDRKDDECDDLDSLIDKADEDVHELDYQMTVVNPLTGESTVNTNTSAYNSARKAAKESALQEYREYLELKKDRNTEKNQLSIKEKEYKNKMRETYADILSMGKSIKQMKDKINTSNKDMANLKVKYNLGIVGKNDYENELCSYRNMDIELREKINSYNELVAEFEMPWAVSI